MLVPDDAQTIWMARGAARELFRGAVGGTVIHHDDSQVRVVLGQPRIQGAADLLAFVAGGDAETGRRKFALASAFGQAR
jgi:hypothetical protein